MHFQPLKSRALISGVAAIFALWTFFGGHAMAFTLGMAVGGDPSIGWMAAQGDVARALARQRGWEYIELSNNHDPIVAIKNADIFIQRHVDVVIQFNGTSQVNPVLATKYAAANIPVVTFELPQKGFYFVGIDNLAAGISGGKAIGKIARERWNCEVDLVISSEASAAHTINELRTGGMRTGLKEICPAIAGSDYVSIEGNGEVAVSLQAGRDLLAAHPEARKILVIGINDGGVLGVLQAAEQLGRAGEIIGWGQDGSFITGENVNPHLSGSVFYFLEGYPVYALRDVVDKIAAGKKPIMMDDPAEPAAKPEACPVTAAQAARMPDLEGRVKALLAAPEGSTEYDLFCK
ncbi:substrate-binding domain-containing protein [Mesorhizobium opportunistum]|uniref:sugar ABC transporter substrate-binding protein n=1 Tax=Mesorhizobium opportunistum TaxID=593909 RepID=UPI00333C1289